MVGGNGAQGRQILFPLQGGGGQNTHTGRDGKLTAPILHVRKTGGHVEKVIRYDSTMVRGGGKKVTVWDAKQKSVWRKGCRGILKAAIFKREECEVGASLLRGRMTSEGVKKKSSEAGNLKKRKNHGSGRTTQIWGGGKGGVCGRGGQNSLADERGDVKRKGGRLVSPDTRLMRGRKPCLRVTTGRMKGRTT